MKKSKQNTEKTERLARELIAFKRFDQAALCALGADDLDQAARFLGQRDFLASSICRTLTVDVKCP